MYYRVFESGGKQYRAAAGDFVKVEKLNAREGEEVVFDKVLYAADGKGEAKEDGGGDKTLRFGAPYIQQEKVRAVIVRHARGPKIKIIKFKRRKHSLKWQGHRQWFSEVLILAPDEKVDAKKIVALKAARSIAKLSKLKASASKGRVQRPSKESAAKVPSPAKQAVKEEEQKQVKQAIAEPSKDKTPVASPDAKKVVQAPKPPGRPSEVVAPVGAKQKGIAGRPNKSLIGKFLGRRGSGDRAGKK